MVITWRFPGIGVPPVITNYRCIYPHKASSFGGMETPMLGGSLRPPFVFHGRSPAATKKRVHHRHHQHLRAIPATDPRPRGAADGIQRQDAHRDLLPVRVADLLEVTHLRICGKRIPRGSLRHKYIAWQLGAFLCSSFSRSMFTKGLEIDVID